MPLEDRYQLEAQLGRGHTGVVYRARDRLTGRAVAVKFLREPGGGEPGEATRARFRREAELLARIRHPSVVQILDARSDGEHPALVTELVEGESLEERLRREGRLGVERSLSLVAQAARGLAAAHGQGVVHRDVKPANLLVTADGTLKITDFSVAAEPGATTDGDRSYFLGTPAYVAPEQWLGRPLDGRADLYALGVVLYRCLTGRLPHHGTTSREIVHRALDASPTPPSHILPTLPPVLDDVCKRLLAREPSQRFSDGQALAESLEHIVVPSGDGTETGVPPLAVEEAIERTSPQRVRSLGRWDSWRVAAAIAAVIVGAFVVEVGRNGGLPNAPGDGPAGGESRLLVEPPPDRAAVPDVPLEVSSEQTAVSTPPSASPAGESALRPGVDPDPHLIERYGAIARARERARREPSPAGETAQVRQSRPAQPAPAVPRPPAEGEARRPPPRPAAETPQAGRAAILVHHELEEGLVEIRVDGRREALRRIGGDGALPGETVSVRFDVDPGEHEIEVRLLSATERVDVGSSWTARWADDQFRGRELTLSRDAGGRWQLDDRGGR